MRVVENDNLNSPNQDQHFDNLGSSFAATTFVNLLYM